MEESETNPTVIIEPTYILIDGHKTAINVIRDDYLPGGSKQRGMIPYMQKSKAHEFVYVSPSNGSAQVTLAYSSSLTNKKVTVFMTQTDYRHPLTDKALKFDSFTLREYAKKSMKDLNSMAKSYVDNIKKDKGDDYIELLSLGFKNSRYADCLYENIRKAVPQDMLDNPPERLWVPSGSSLLVNVLYKIFPKTHFIVVQTGKKIWDDQIDKTRTTIYRSKEFFFSRALVQPPYPTTKSYDAKSWVFVTKYAKDNDYIWNITQDFDYDYKMNFIKNMKKCVPIRSFIEVVRRYQIDNLKRFIIDLMFKNGMKDYENVDKDLSYTLLNVFLNRDNDDNLDPVLSFNLNDKQKTVFRKFTEKRINRNITDECEDKLKELIADICIDANFGTDIYKTVYKRGQLIFSDFNRNQRIEIKLSNDRYEEFKNIFTGSEKDFNDYLFSFFYRVKLLKTLDNKNSREEEFSVLLKDFAIYFPKHT